ncbi:hypothetical protein CS542_10410 [Pedobacter sp. IW39]|nr:hypothetical protein CS542_10410 [Pedobacter sp. IW39]
MTRILNSSILELMPYLNKKQDAFSERASDAHCSGLTAFDIVWKNDNFDTLPEFSGSFWWRKDLKDGYTDDDRIIPGNQTPKESRGKVLLMTGTKMKPQTKS